MGWGWGAQAKQARPWLPVAPRAMYPRNNLVQNILLDLYHGALLIGLYLEVVKKVIVTLYDITSESITGTE